MYIAKETGRNLSDSSLFSILPPSSPSPPKAYCNQGYFTKTDQSGCDACPAGTVGNGDETTRYSASTGCVACPLATYSAAEGVDSVAKCVKCAPGKRGREGMAAGASNEAAGCEDCGIGKYTNKLGQTSCTTCDSGMVTNGMGQTFCSPCDAGESRFVLYTGVGAISPGELRRTHIPSSSLWIIRLY